MRIAYICDFSECCPPLGLFFVRHSSVFPLPVRKDRHVLISLSNLLQAEPELQLLLVDGRIVGGGDAEVLVLLGAGDTGHLEGFRGAEKETGLT